MTPGAASAGNGRVTAVCRRSDGSCVASELYASYPVRLHLTSRPNHRPRSFGGPPSSRDGEGQNDPPSSHPSALSVYVLGYGGGLISGDRIDLSFHVKTSASLLVTSQSTSKAYKSIRGRPATMVKTSTIVEKDGLLVLVPQPTQCFGGSRLVQETHVLMGSEEGGGDEAGGPLSPASLLLVDWYTGGRPNLDGGLWNLDSFRNETTVSYLAQPLTTEHVAGLDGGSSGNKGKKTLVGESHRRLVFRDATRLSGGSELRRHMRNFNVVCMVAMIGPRVKAVGKLFRQKFASRHSYHEGVGEDRVDTPCVDGRDWDMSEKGGDMNEACRRSHNAGEGFNSDGLLVSCGTFCTMDGLEDGVVLRLAARSVEQAAMFLSKHIGNLEGQLENDPFFEILVSRQGASVSRSLDLTGPAAPNMKSFSGELKLSFGLTEKSFATERSSAGHPERPSQPRNCTSGDCSEENDNQQTNNCDLPTGLGVRPVILYQLIDSSAPTGGFAHSNTVEVAHQLHFLDRGHCTSSSRLSGPLMEHVWDVLLQTITCTVPFLIASCRLFGEYDGGQPGSEANAFVDRWETLDTDLSANITSHVTARASSLQGSGMLRAFAHTFPAIANVVKIMKKRVSSTSGQRGCRGHAATCFGAICGLLGVDAGTCASMFLYTTARDMINAAVRMNLVGPLEGGRLTNELCTRLELFIEVALGMEVNAKRSVLGEATIASGRGIGGNDVKEQWSDPHSAHQVAPLVEVLANAHDRLYTRLFNS